MNLRADHPLRREGVRALINVLVSMLVGMLVLALFRTLWPWTPMALRADLDREINQRSKVESSLAQVTASLERTVTVVELQATINASDPQSEEFKEAQRDLRRLRRVTLMQRK